MRVASLLRERQTALHQRWLERVVESYAGDAARFFRREKNPFANPVGVTLKVETEALIAGFLDEAGADVLAPPLERLLKVRAVQDFSPAEMLGFIFLLKPVMRETLEDEWGTPEIVDEYLALCERVDAIGLLAFDVLSAIRERIHEIRVGEVKRRVSSILRRSPLWDGDGDCVPFQDNGPRAGAPSGLPPGDDGRSPEGDR